MNGHLLGYLHECMIRNVPAAGHAAAAEVKVPAGRAAVARAYSSRVVSFYAAGL